MDASLRPELFDFHGEPHGSLISLIICILERPECQKLLLMFERVPFLKIICPPFNAAVFGSWYDHVSGWWEKKQSVSKLHYMFFEDLVENTGREVDRLCSFLGVTLRAEKKEQIRGAVQ